MHLFFAPNIEETPFLNEEESLHCIKVLRMQAGDELQIINGRGTMYEARIVNPHQKHTEVQLVKAHHDFGTHPYQLHIAVAPTKNIDRFEWFVEKATEIGVDTITPALCRFSERKVVKLDRIEKIAISASKQSYKATVPTIQELTSVTDIVKQATESQRFIAHCYDDGDRRLLSKIVQPNSDCLILIGPEGDFSPEEVELALQHGFVPISLGNSRLRTETAAVVAVHTVALTNE